MRSPFALCLTGILLVVPCARSAADQDVVIEEVVVSAHRVRSTLPPSIANLVLRADDIERSLSTSLADVLGRQPGVQVSDAFSDGSQTQVSLRGFGGNAGANALIVLDGRRLNPVDQDTADLNTVALGNLDRIEILQGSDAVRYGDQASGGVIYLQSARAGNGEHRLAIGAGSYDTKRIDGTVDALINQTGVRAALNHLDSNGYRDDARLKRTEGLIALSHDFDDTQVDLQWQRVWQDRQALGALTEEQLRSDRRQSGSLLRIDGVTDNQRFSARREFEAAMLELDIFHTDFHSRAPSRSETFGNATTRIDRTQWSVQPRVAISRGPVSIIGGVDLDRQSFAFNNQSDAFGNSSTTQHVDGVAGYASLYWQLSPVLQLDVGARRHHSENRVRGVASGAQVREQLDERFTGTSAGAHWQIGSHWYLSARVANSFRVPKADEQVSVFDGFTALRTQHGWSHESTLGYVNADVSGRVSVFQLNLNDEIDFDPRTGFFGTNINLPRTRRRGVIADVQWAVNERVSTGINGQFVRAALNANRTVPFVAERIASGWLDVRATDWLTSRAELQYIGPRYAIGDFDNRNQRQGGFAIANLALRATRQDVTLTLRLDNVFSKRYNALVSYVNFLDALTYQPGAEQRFMLNLEWTPR